MYIYLFHKKTIEKNITFNQSNVPEYHFNTKDHLGNIRVVQTANGAIEEVNHYYPYGSLFGESTGLANSTQPYKYTGKELDRMHGLDLHDHGARWSDTNLARWPVMDPLAEEYTWMSPYALCGNNPMNTIDKDGRKIVIWYNNKEGEKQSYVFTGFHGDRMKVPNNAFVKDFINAYKYNTNNGGGDNMRNAALSSDITIHVIQGNSTEFYSERKQIIIWEPRKGLKTTEGGKQSPATRLEHEFDHAVDNIKNHKEHQLRRETYNKQYHNDEEKRVIIGSERKTARKNNESIRYNHQGTTYDVEGPTSIHPLKKVNDE